MSSEEGTFLLKNRGTRVTLPLAGAGCGVRCEAGDQGRGRKWGGATEEAVRRDWSLKCDTGRGLGSTKETGKKYCFVCDFGVKSMYVDKPCLPKVGAFENYAIFSCREVYWNCCLILICFFNIIAKPIKGLFCSRCQVIKVRCIGLCYHWPSA